MVKPFPRNTKTAVIRGPIRTAVAARPIDSEVAVLRFRCYRCGALKPSNHLVNIGSDGVMNVACCRGCLSPAELRYLEEWK